MSHVDCVLAQGLWDELGSVVILVVLYMMQGVPLGLTMGAMCAPCLHPSLYVSSRGPSLGCTWCTACRSGSPRAPCACPAQDGLQSRLWNHVLLYDLYVGYFHADVRDPCYRPLLPPQQLLKFHGGSLTGKAGLSHTTRAPQRAPLTGRCWAPGRSCCSRGRRTPRSGFSAWPRTPTPSSCCGAPWWTRCTRWHLAGGSPGWCALSHMLGSVQAPGWSVCLGMRPERRHERCTRICMLPLVEGDDGDLICMCPNMLIATPHAGASRLSHPCKRSCLLLAVHPPYTLSWGMLSGLSSTCGE